MKKSDTPQYGLRLLPYNALVRDMDSNVRTRYDADGLQEMKESVRKHGILQNLGATPLKDGHFEVVWGFRRHLGVEALIQDLVAEGSEEALKLAELRSLVPVKVLTPEEAKHHKLLQALENLQKEGLDPVDEARGYQKLLAETDDAGGKVYPSHQALAEALGKPNKGERYIGQRLKLLEAPDFLLDALRDGIVPSVRIAEMIGAMPGQKAREKMARFAIKHPVLGIPMTTVQVEDMIGADFNRSLMPAQFDLEATDLLDANQKAVYGFTGAPGSKDDGSCERCCKRTGCDPLLKGRIQAAGGTGAGGTRGIPAYVCQMPECMALKLEGEWRAVQERAEAAGHRVMDRVKAKKLWPGGSYGGDETEPYIRRDWRPDHSCTGHMAQESMPTWGEILDSEKPSWIMAQAPKGKGWVYLLERDQAIEIAEAKWAREKQPNLFANRPGAKGKPEGGSAKAEVKPTPAATTTTTVTTVATSTAAVPPAASAENNPVVKAKLAEAESLALLRKLVVYEEEGTGDSVFDLWMEILRRQLWACEAEALRLLVQAWEIERDPSTLSGEQLIAILEKRFEGYNEGRCALYVESDFLFVCFANDLVKCHPNTTELLRRAFTRAGIDAEEVKLKVRADLQPKKPSEPEKAAKKEPQGGEHVASDGDGVRHFDVAIDGWHPWIEAMLHEAFIKETPVNEHGVNAGAARFEFRLKGKEKGSKLEVSLGCWNGVWRSGRSADWCTRKGRSVLGGGCGASHERRDRGHAVCEELVELRKKAADADSPETTALIDQCLFYLRNDHNLIPDQARPSSALKPVETKPQDELFECPKCGRKNFTKRGLQAHNCGKGQANKAVVEAQGEGKLKAYLRSLLDAPVAVSEPTAKGIFDAATVAGFVWDFPANGWLGVSLATDKRGFWFIGFGFEVGDARTERPVKTKPHCFNQRATAVMKALELLQASLKKERLEGSAAVAARMREILINEPLEEVVYESAVPEPGDGTDELFQTPGRKAVAEAVKKIEAKTAAKKGSK